MVSDSVIRFESVGGTAREKFKEHVAGSSTTQIRSKEVIPAAAVQVFWDPAAAVQGIIEWKSIPCPPQIVFRAYARSSSLVLV